MLPKELKWEKVCDLLIPFSDTEFSNFSSFNLEYQRPVMLSLEPKVLEIVLKQVLSSAKLLSLHWPLFRVILINDY